MASRKGHCGRKAALKIMTSKGSRDRRAQFNHEPKHRRSKAQSSDNWSPKLLLKRAAAEAAIMEYVIANGLQRQSLSPMDKLCIGRRLHGCTYDPAGSKGSNGL